MPKAEVRGDEGEGRNLKEREKIGRKGGADYPALTSDDVVDAASIGATSGSVAGVGMYSPLGAGAS